MTDEQHLPDDFDRTIVSLGEGDVLSQRYRLVLELGRGGMGVVWLALDETLDGREVAIKLLPTGLNRDKRAIGRLKQEAQKSLDLTHTHIVRLINFEQDASRGGLAYLVMQYVKGETLNDRLVDHPDGLPLEDVLPWAKQLASALDHAHGKGVLHRDIKPSNIMIDDAGDVYLMDFGIARELRETMTRLTGRDSSGTLPYMSPQQMRGKDMPSNDTYSLAATLYEALSGEPPFSRGDIAHQILREDPVSIEGLPDQVNAALLSGLAKENEERPTSVEEFVHTLRAERRVECEAQLGVVAAKRLALGWGVPLATMGFVIYMFIVCAFVGVDPFGDNLGKLVTFQTRVWRRGAHIELADGRTIWAHPARRWRDTDEFWADPDTGTGTRSSDVTRTQPGWGVALYVGLLGWLLAMLAFRRFRRSLRQHRRDEAGGARDR